MPTMDDDFEDYPHAYALDDDMIIEENRVTKSMIENETLSDMVGVSHDNQLNNPVLAGFNIPQNFLQQRFYGGQDNEEDLNQ